MILITGAARSGTSLVTQILQSLGVDLGRATAINPLYENTDLRENVLKPFLTACGADPMGQAALPRTEELVGEPGMREAILARFEGRPESWAWKDAKLCLIWPTLAAAFPDARWIIVRRDADEIVDSCVRCPWMRHYGDDRAGWLVWVGQHLARFEIMKAALGAQVMEVWPRDFMADPEVFRPVAEHCGLAFDPAAVTAAIDPALYRAA